MATTERPDEPAADRVTASLGDAGFVRVVAAPRGDALAALGVLCRALDDRNRPFKAAVRRAGETGDAGEADATIAIGLDPADATHAFTSDPVTDAYAVASALTTPDAVLGLAGTLACGGVDAGPIPDDAVSAGLSRRPGLAIPSADPADGLAHSTLVYGPFSGETGAVDGIIGEFEASADGWRRVASNVALVVAESAPPASRAGTALERLLRPHAGGPFETVGGYADVLDALARRAPGLGIAAVLGDVDPDAALDVWRSHGLAVHDAVAAADVRRHDGLVTVDSTADDAVVEPVARLVRDYRSPEPAAFVVGRGRCALAVCDDADAASLLRESVREGTAVDGDGGVASASADPDNVETALRDRLGGEP